MNKVHVIATAGDAVGFQQQVNEFIADKKVIDIKYQPSLFSTEWHANGTPKNIHCNDRAMIIYEVDDTPCKNVEEVNDDGEV